MLYTKKGDKGDTKLFGCSVRISKSDHSCVLLGSLDELNSSLGVSRAQAVGYPDIQALLLSIQENLFVLQAIVAGALKTVTPGALDRLEKAIGLLEKELPPITSFTIPGSTPLSAFLDVSRTVARRAEREAVIAVESGRPLPDGFLPYLNRLSSALFAAARVAAHRSQGVELRPSYT